jgi:hypothetical protein
MNKTTYKFQKALDQKPDPELAEGLVECQDLDFGSIGSARSVLDNLYNTGPAGTFHSMELVGLPTKTVILIGIDGDLWGMDLPLGTSGAYLIKSGLSGNKLTIVSALGRAYFTDQTQLYKWDGTSVYKCGTPVPGTALTAADNAVAGGLDGTFNFKVTFVNSNGFEGNASPIGSVTVNVAGNRSINLSAIPVNADMDYNVTQRKIYIQGGTTPYYPEYVLLDTIPDNTDTTLTGINSSWVDTHGDPTFVLETDNNLPPTGIKYLCLHYGVLLYAGNDENTLGFSKTNKPEQFPASYGYTISRSGDPIKQLSASGGTAFAITKRGIWEMVGSPGQGVLSTNFYIKETQAIYGTIGSRSVVTTPYGGFYWSEDGIRKFDGNASEIFSNDVEDEFNARSYVDAAEELTNGVFHDDKLFYSYCDNTSPTPNKTLIYDFRTSSWTTHGEAFYSMVSDRRTRKLYLGSTSLREWRGGTTYRSWFLRTGDTGDGDAFRVG